MQKICSFQKNQHKLEYAYNKAISERYDAYESGERINEAERKVEEIESIYVYFNTHVDHHGMVYASAQYDQKIKEIIAWYDVKHDMGW